MRVLYAIQGTGNGHLSRARDIVPILQQQADLDILVSGTQSQVQLPYPIRYQLKGFSFLYNRKGGIAYARSSWHNLSYKLLRDIVRLPVQEYDLILNDFEPVSAWAARLRGIPCIALGHQAAFQSPLTPRPRRKDRFGEWVLKHYAPAGQALGFHFERYADFIHPPVIRQGIRQQIPTQEGHYTVYLPAFRDVRLIDLLTQIPFVRWEVFSRETNETYSVQNVTLRPISHDAFIESFVRCTGVLTGAGFETPAEALYMGKKLLVVPIRGQYEQQCNAAALERLGVPVVSRLNQESLPIVQQWVGAAQDIQLDFPDHTEKIMLRLLQQHRWKRSPRVLV